MDRRDETVVEKSLQQQCYDWVVEAGGVDYAHDRIVRNHRFFEEAAETVQALGCSREDCHTLVDYVFDRAPGIPRQEIGGAVLTLMALAEISGIDALEAGGQELERNWCNIAAIKRKIASRPANSPLPQTIVLPDADPPCPKCGRAFDRGFKRCLCGWIAGT